MNWINNTDTYNCPVCGFECNNPNKLPNGTTHCPRCGQQFDWNFVINYDRLFELAEKMHLYIFMHADNIDEAYKEIGLKNYENKILGMNK